jgi:hypothetical protein
MTRPQFGLMAHFYYWVFVALILGAPFTCIYAHVASEGITIASLCPAVTMSSLAGLLLWISHRQCGTDQMSYREGMLFITVSMMTGWTYLTLLVVFPALFAAFLVVGVYALISVARSDRDWARIRFRRVVGFCCRNRMRQ